MHLVQQTIIVVAFDGVIECELQSFSAKNKQNEMIVPQNGKQGNASEAIRTISFCYRQHVLRTYVQQRTGQNSTNKKAISWTIAKVLFRNVVCGIDSVNARVNGVCSQPTFSGYSSHKKWNFGSQCRLWILKQTKYIQPSKAKIVIVCYRVHCKVYR